MLALSNVLAYLIILMYIFNAELLLVSEYFYSVVWVILLF